MSEYHPAIVNRFERFENPRFIDFANQMLALQSKNADVERTIVGIDALIAAESAFREAAAIGSYASVQKWAGSSQETVRRER